MIIKKINKIGFILLFSFFSLLGYNQNNEVKKDQDDHKKIEKELNQMLERNQSDSVELNLQQSEQEVPESVPEIKEESPLAPPSPAPSKSNFNVKSEPVPGAEIIIDKVPASDKKKNKIKSASNQALPVNNKTNEEQDINKHNE
jgi:hypothetical protein